MDPKDNKDNLFNPNPNREKKVSDYAHNNNVFEQASGEHFQKNALNNPNELPKDDKIGFTDPFAKGNPKDNQKNIVEMIDRSVPEKMTRQKIITIIACVAGILVIAGIVAALFIINNQKKEPTVEPEKPLFGEEVNDYNTASAQGLTCYIDTKEDKTFAFTGFDSLSVKRNVTFSNAGTPLIVKSDYMYSFNNEAAIEPYFNNFRQLYEGKYPTKDDYYFKSSLTQDKTGFLLSIEGLVVNIRYDEYLEIFGLAADRTGEGDDAAVSYDHWTDTGLKARWESEGFTCTLNVEPTPAPEADAALPAENAN
jgi:hypothetical protein